MRKYFAILAVLAMVSQPGCCTLTAPDGTETKSLANCIATAQYKVCNADAGVIAAADMVLSLAKIVIAAAAPGSQPYMDAVNAYATATGIQATGCAILTDLNRMIVFIKSPEVKAAEAKLMVKKGPMRAQPVSPQVFVDWRNSFK
jgi:hypothetical protein